MRFVIDLDDTICVTKNRDYNNSTEIAGVANKIRRIKELMPSAEIIIHTARGMASCKGDAKAAELKNRGIIERWLGSRRIPYDEIIFGKPLGDVYIDDKAMTAMDFSSADVEVFRNGFSGAKVVRVGNYVVKEMDDAALQAEWYHQAKKHYKNIGVPTVYSVTLGKIYMNYIGGVSCAKVVNEEILKELLSLIQSEEALHCDNDINKYADYVNQKAEELGITTDVADKIRCCKRLRERTFCHGDLSLLNIIYNDQGLNFIDPSPKQRIESWIVDAAKIRCSLAVLDKALAGISHSKTLLEFFDSCISNEDDLEEIKIVEQSHAIRVLYYARKNKKKAVEETIASHYGW